jgi:hypothetical protein
MKGDKKNIIVLVLFLIIIILLGFIAYFFLIMPAINGFVTGEQNKGIQYGAQYAILTIAQQAATCQQVPLTVGNDTINLIAVGCLPAECLQPAE